MTKRQIDYGALGTRVADAAFRLPAELRADCTACCGLCCVALPFDASEAFAFDKPAHTPCVLLRSDDRCAIHDQLAARGFPGCAAYECYGAGQWVVQRCFKGASWRASPRIAAQMFDAFRRIRALHELMAMLLLAIARTPDPCLRGELLRMLEELESLHVEEPATLKSIDLVAIKRRVAQLMRKLSPSAPLQLQS